MKYIVLYFILLICYISWNCENSNNDIKNYEIACKLYDIGDFDSCILILEGVISKSPDSITLSEAYYLRGKAYGNLSKRSEAIESYNNALNYKYKYPSLIYNDRGHQLQEMGDFLASIEDFTLAISFDSSLPIYFNNRGFSYLKILNYDAALSDFNKAIQIDSLYAGAYNNKAILLSLLSNYEESLVNFNTAVKIDSRYKEAIFGRASISILLNRYDDALYDLAKVIEIDTNFGPAYFSAGQIFFKVGNYEEACIQFENASNCGVFEADSILIKYCK